MCRVKPQGMGLTPIRAPQGGVDHRPKSSKAHPQGPKTVALLKKFKFVISSDTQRVPIGHLGAIMGKQTMASLSENERHYVF